MGKVIDLFKTAGDGISQLFGSENPNVVYFFFVVSTFMIIYLLVRGALSVGFSKSSKSSSGEDLGVKGFSGGHNKKSINVLAIFISLIATPALFWGKNTEQIITFMNNFFVLGILALIVIGWNGWLITKFWIKDEFFKDKNSLRILLFSLSLYVTLQLFNAPFVERIGENVGGFLGTIYNITSTTETLSFIVMIVSLMIWVISKLNSGVLFSGRNSNVGESVSNLKELIRSLHQRRVSLDNHFANLNNILNGLGGKN